MSTFAEFITACDAQIENKNTRTTPYLKDATVRWLKEISNVRALFMEASFSFATVVDQSRYTVATSGFPPDVMEFQTIYRETGTAPELRRDPLDGPKPVRDVREWQSSSGDPVVWAWHQNALLLAPVPSVVLTLSGDYFKDATRDSASGAVITAASTTHTNPWFDRGEQALRNAVLMDYFSSIAKDAEAASLCERLYDKAIGSIQRDLRLKNLQGAQAQWVWG